MLSRPNSSDVPPISIPATLALLPARTLFLIASQALFALIFYLRHDPHHLRTSAAWWSVYGTLADLGCLALLGSRHLPLFAMIYSFTLWWFIWSATEELTYQTFRG